MSCIAEFVGGPQDGLELPLDNAETLREIEFPSIARQATPMNVAFPTPDMYETKRVMHRYILSHPTLDGCIYLHESFRCLEDEQ